MPPDLLTNLKPTSKTATPLCDPRFAFENGKAVSEWLDFVLGKSADPPEFMRRDAPPDRKRPRKKGEGGGPEIEQEAPTGGGAGGGQQQLQHLAAGVGGGQQVCLPPFAAAAPTPPQTAVAFFAGGGGMLPLPNPQHQHQQPTLQPCLTAQQQQQPPSGRFYQSSLASSFPAPPVHSAAAAPTLAADLQSVFSSDPELCRWVTAVPSEQEVAAFSRWAARLRPDAVGDDGGAPDGGLEGAQHAQQGQGRPHQTSTVDALRVLGELALFPVNLRLLEASGIGRAVAELAAGAACQSVREAAARVAARWRGAAAAALAAASRALEEGFACGGGGGLAGLTDVDLELEWMAAMAAGDDEGDEGASGAAAAVEYVVDDGHQVV